MFIIEILVLLGGGLFIVHDYKNDFKNTKSLVKKGGSVLRRISGKKEEENPKKAAEIVQGWAKNIGLLRESAASIRAGQQLAETKQQENLRLAEDFSKLVVAALQKGNEKEAEAASFGKIQSERKAEIYSDHASEQKRAADALERQLASLEQEFELIQVEAETIEINDQVAEAGQRLYGLLSHIESKTGFTPRGELKRLAEHVQFRRLKTANLLRLASDSQLGKVGRLTTSVEVQAEIARAQEWLMLGGKTEIGDSRSDVTEIKIETASA